MYLKRLELQGFKSFANRTVFEFAPGITAVIGPNGSGKSNVADALRWVLGEQSSRLLRTRKLEDVIFAGSSGRATMGFAEVSITLDNSDRRLPIDFNELVLTRRLYRSGESEYLLNRQRTRLREVTDLLLRANISPSGYGFIGQGQIDHLLSLRPEERRLLLEDAADVRRYRLRMEEAQDKLAATRDNLDRVQLLIQEIEPRLAQLAKQAELAADYSRLTRQLAQALQAWYDYRWQETRRALTTARTTYEQRQEALRAAQADLIAARERLRALERAVEDRRRAVAEQQNQKTRRAEDLRQTEQALTLDRERVRMLTARREEINRELATLEEEFHLQPLDVLEADRERSLTDQITALQGRLTEARQQSAEIAQEAAAKRQQVEAAEARLAEAQRQVEALQVQQERLQQTVQHLEGPLAAVAASRRALLDRLKALALEFRKRWEEGAEFTEEQAKFRQELALMTQRVEHGRDELRRLEDEKRHNEVELQLLRDRLAGLKRLQGGYEGFDSGVRAILQAAGLLGDAPGERRLKGVRGVLAQLLIVPEGLERAIEVALGESLQALVTDRLEEAEAAIQLLVAHQAGRAVVYPLEMLRPVSPLNLMPERGVIGVASTLVRCDRIYRPLVDLLLGRVIVVEDLPTAHRIIRRGLGSVVTLDGIMLRPTGAVSGGTAATAPVTDTFTHERELAAIPQEIARLEQETQVLVRRLQVRRQALLADEESLRRLQGLEAEFHAFEAGLQEFWVRHRGELARIGSELRWARQHEREQQEEIARTRSKFDHLTAEIAAAQEQVHARLAEVEAVRSAYREVERRHEAALQEAASLSAAIAGLEADLRPLARIRQQVEAAVTRLQTQIAQRHEQLAAIAKDIERLELRIVEKEHERLLRQAQLRELDATLEPGLAELAHLESRHRELAAEIAAIQSQVLDHERRYLEVEGVLRRREEELASLHAEIEREGLAITEGEGTTEARVMALPSTGEDGPPPPPIGGGMDARALEKTIAQLRAQIRALGPVNAQAQQDYAESKERYDFLAAQMRDLEEAEVSFRQAIDELQRLIREKFRAAFREVSERFSRYFATLFGGGTARLALTEPEDYATSGIEIMAQPPGKRLGTLTLLSGGERSLTGVALLLALMETNPSPFCVLDEVDAALDEANVGRFAAALKTLAEQTQFIVITHNRKTIEYADYIYGVSMGRDGVSSVLSLRLADLIPT